MSINMAQNSEQQPDLTIDAAMRLSAIEGILQHLREKYVYPEVAEQMERSIRERQQKGEYGNITSAIAFAAALQSQLQEISQDKHIRVISSSEPQFEVNQDQAPSPEQQAERLSWLKARNYGFEKAERLNGNIGYLKFNLFCPPELGGETAIASMNFLANTDALIIDLCNNGGGSLAMVALITSYLFDSEPVHLNSLYWRPEDRTHQWWTLPYVPGKRFGTDKAVYVLTSRRTFSAAEEFSYNLQNLKRATIIGEVTGGGAHPGGRFQINEHFAVRVPSGRAINPI